MRELRIALVQDRKRVPVRVPGPSNFLEVVHERFAFGRDLDQGLSVRASHQPIRSIDSRPDGFVRGVDIERQLEHSARQLSPERLLDDVPNRLRSGGAAARSLALIPGRIAGEPDLQTPCVASPGQDYQSLRQFLGRLLRRSCHQGDLVERRGLDQAFTREYRSQTIPYVLVTLRDVHGESINVEIRSHADLRVARIERALANVLLFVIKPTDVRIEAVLQARARYIQNNSKP